MRSTQRIRVLLAPHVPRPGNFLSKSVANLNEKSLSCGAVPDNACTGDQPQVGGGCLAGTGLTGWLAAHR